MAEYIEREALKQSIRNMPRTFHPELVFNSSVQKIISNAPAADVVEVVRCNECIHWGGVTFGQVCRRWSGTNLKNHTQPYDYCSCGERKDGAE